MRRASRLSTRYDFRAVLLAVFALLFCFGARAQVQPGRGQISQTQDSTNLSEEKPIQDNSFLLEEAYNQEDRVVQHISLFTRFWDDGDWAYNFTQEWPFPRYFRNQFSYTLAVVNPTGAQGFRGFGDLMLHYRYQAIGSGDTRLAFAPRVSLLLPTGNSKFSRGVGGPAIQTNLPASLVLHKSLVTHLNAGMTLIPRAENESGDRARVVAYNLGQSFIWLLHPRINPMLETVWNDTDEVVGSGKTERSRDLLFVPGIRFAHNLKNGLQIVPGVGMAVGAGPSAGKKGLVLYLSFEHPF